MAKRHERTSARRMAVQVLYTCEIQGQSPQVLLDEGRCILATSDEVEADDGTLLDRDAVISGANERLSDYALSLIRGVEAHRDEVDEYLTSTSENWKITRMPIVDRSILRLAAYEMIYVQDVPISVSINEAVELAKIFGGEDESPRFVNGVLGRIAKRLEESQPVTDSSVDVEA